MIIKRNFFFIAALLQCLFVIVCILNHSHTYILFRQTIGFVYYLVIPGALILTILNNTTSPNKFILYSIGFSLFFITSIGMLANFILPFFGITKPISEINLLVILNLSCFILLLISLTLCRKQDVPIFDLSVQLQNLKIKILLILLVPFLAIFGSYFLSFYNNNTLILITLCIILTFPMLVALDKVPPELYSLLLVVSAFVLLSYNNFVGMYIRPTDAVFEFHYISSVIKKGTWNWNLNSNLNSMTYVSLLPSILSIVLHIPLTWIYKVVAPLISLTIPFGLYTIYRDKWGEKVAFFATYFFISMFTYYTWCAITMKMLFAGIFLILVLLSAFDASISKLNKKLFLIIFSFSLIISHYGTSYIFLISVLLSTFVYYILHKLSFRYNKFCSLVNLNYSMYYIVCTLFWYTFIGSSSAYATIINLGKRVIRKILKLYLPKSTTTVLLSNWSITIQALKILYLVSLLFIFIGIFYEIKKYSKSDEYLMISIPFIGILLIDYAFVGYYTGRIWYIISILLAPYCIMGILHTSQPLRKRKYRYSILVVYLILFLIFNSGISNVIFNDYGPGIYLCKGNIRNNNIYMKERFFRKYIVSYDVASAKWLSRYKSSKIIKIYSDARCRDILCSYGGLPLAFKIHYIYIYRNISYMKFSYIYFRYISIKQKIVVYSFSPLIIFNTRVIFNKMPRKYLNKIYSNNYSYIYLLC